MELRQLRYLVQIIKCGSISRAAEILHVAQPSLSLQIKNLEDELGVPLLVRHARGVLPTEFGATFAEQAELILGQAERAKDSVRSIKSSPAGRIAIGLPLSVCRGMALSIIRDAGIHYPGLQIHIIEAMTPTLDEWIRSGRIDVALLYNYRPFEKTLWTEVLSENLMIIVPAGSPAAAAPQLSLRQALKLPLVLPGPSNVVRLLIEQLAAGLKLRISTMDCDSLSAIRHLVRTGFSTILPHFCFIDEIERGEVVAVPFADEPPPSWRLTLVISQRSPNQRACRAVGDLLIKVCLDLIRSGTWKATSTYQATPLGGLE